MPPKNMNNATEATLDLGQVRAEFGTPWLLCYLLGIPTYIYIYIGVYISIPADAAGQSSNVSARCGVECF